jgi:predicted ester cyclase
MWFGMDPLVELQQMGVAPVSPPRRPQPTGQSNLTAFLSATEMPTGYDSVTAFDDTVIAFSPPQSSRSSVTRLVEIHRFAGDESALIYRHEITTEPPYGGDPSVDTETSRAVVGRWFDEVLRGHRLAALAEVASPNILVHATAMPCEAGFYAHTGAVQWLQEQWAAFPDLTVVDDFTVASGDIVAVRWKARGTSWGQFLGVAPTGHSLDYTGLSMYRVEGGRIAEIWETRNTIGIIHQLDPRIGGGHHH